MRQVRTPYTELLFCFNDTANTEIYTLSLHDALPISRSASAKIMFGDLPPSSRETRLMSRLASCMMREPTSDIKRVRSEEHTSELQSQFHLVCRLLLEKKNECKGKATRVLQFAN